MKHLPFFRKKSTIPEFLNIDDVSYVFGGRGIEKFSYTKLMNIDQHIPLDLF